MRIDSLGFWPVPATLLALAAVAWWSMRPMPSEKSPQLGAPAVEATGARSIIVREGGHKAWEFSAERITIAPDRIRASIEKIANGVIFQDGRPLWRLKAERVEANQLTRDVQAQNAEASLATRGLQISTSSALWKHREKMLVCAQPTHAKMKNIRVQANAVAYNVKNGELSCREGVEVSSPFGTLSAPAATAYPAERRVEFHGGVDIIMHREALPLPR